MRNQHDRPRSTIVRVEDVGTGPSQVPYLATFLRTVLDIKRVENAFFHSMYIFSVILHAIDKHDIST